MNSVAISNIVNRLINDTKVTTPLYDIVLDLVISSKSGIRDKQSISSAIIKNNNINAPKVID